MKKSKLQMVKEFNNEIIGMPTVKLAHCLPPDRVNWFGKVICEELDEFREAYQLKDNVGMLDALIDMAYFVLGRVQECGFTEAQWDKCFAAVHEANMTKRKGNKGRGSDIDAVKDSNWVGPEERIREILEETKDSACYVPDFDSCADVKPKHQMTEEEIDAVVNGVKEETPAYNYITADANATTEAVRELEPYTAALETVEHRKPSVYLEDDGYQRILSIDELNLFAKMSPVFKEVTEIAIKKSQDYNNGNGQPTSRANYFPFGLLSYAQMLHTKSQRLNSLAQQDKVPNNESVRDTLLDMINYATFAVEAIDKGEI